MKHKIIRKKRIFKKIAGNTEKPRLSVFRSNKHLYLQAINDDIGKTITSASTQNLKIKNLNIDSCREVGLNMGKNLESNSIKKIVFDKNGKKYHGRVAAVAEAIREIGILF